MASSGAAPATSATAWTFGSWATVFSGHPYDLTVYGFTFSHTDNAAIVIDTTIDALFEVGVGPIGSEVTEIQIPFSYRADTKVGYYLWSLLPFLPEPIEIKANNRVAVRAANSIAAAITYNGFSLYYREPPVRLPPDVVTAGVRT